MAKFLGIDYGIERTGLAVSDPLEKLAFPLATLRLKDYGSRSALLDDLCRLALRENVERIVIGLPVLANGTESIGCRQARNFAARLERRLSLPVYGMPETLSSEEAWDDLRQSGLKPEKRRAVLDQQAACRILESFLALPHSQRKAL